MKAWSRTSAIALAIALVALTACSRERSGDVRDGEADADAVEVALEDDEFARTCFGSRPGRR